ncbi:MAG: bacteriohemerythrin [Syntrophomonadaceae bacterium]|nr:bacteriohemerythrin [Syntrophomonadaceae bacterium]
MISWRDEFSIGVKEIDEQHMQLFKIADKAYELLKDQWRDDKYDGIVSILEELKQYTVYHFKFEEYYQMSIKYPKFLSHKIMHDDFIEKINSIDLERIDDNQGQYLLEIMDFIVKWIEGHILGQDKKIVQE